MNFAFAVYLLRLFSKKNITYGDYYLVNLVTKKTQMHDLTNTNYMSFREIQTYSVTVTSSSVFIAFISFPCTVTTHFREERHTYMV